MIGKVIAVIVFSLCLPMHMAFGQQTSGGGGTDEVKNTCEVSGGVFTSSASGWACCWADWGCYGCVDGKCKMKCHTRKCRKANRQSKLGPDSQAVEGLAPQGNPAPIAPKGAKKAKEQKHSATET